MDYVFATYSVLRNNGNNSLSNNKYSRHRSLAIVTELEERMYKYMRILTCLNELILIYI